MKIKFLKILLTYIIKQKKLYKYSDIYKYIKSKIDNNDKVEWPKEFKGIDDKIKLKNKKGNFWEKCKTYFIAKNNRLYKQRTINNPFNGKTYLLSSLILFEEEAIYIIKYFHTILMHIGTRTLQIEIKRRNLYINNSTERIKECVETCAISTMNKLNKYIKPINIQIISKYPLEGERQILPIVIKMLNLLI